MRNNNNLPTGSYVTRRGNIVNMASIIAANEKSIAVGNAGLNARGDILGKGGTIVVTNEQIISEYNTMNENSVRNYSIKGNELPSDFFITPQEASSKIQPKTLEVPIAVDPQNIQSQKQPEQKKRKIIESDE